MTTATLQSDAPIERGKLVTAFESASKVAAAGALLLYTCGYLVTSIYHAQYGMLQNNPFKPRIVSAGGWFLILAFVPIGTVIHFMNGKRIPWSNLLGHLFPYWVLCCTLSLFPAMLFASKDSRAFAFDWRQIAALVIATGVFTALPQFRKLHRLAIPAASVILAVLFAAWSIRNLMVSQRFGYSSIILWFFGIGLITMLELMSIDPPKLWDPRWIRTFFGLLFILFIFAGSYYPHLRASWGGGAPVPVTLYFTGDSIIQPSSKVDALLLDEEDTGLYIKGKTDMTALFIPRNSIALISFSAQSEASELLRLIGSTTPAVNQIPSAPPISIKAKSPASAQARMDHK